MSNPEISNVVPTNSQYVQKGHVPPKARIVQSPGKLSEYVENSLFNPMQMAKRFKELDKLKHQEKKEANENPEDVKIQGLEDVEGSAAEFQEGHPELQSKTLEILRGLISLTDTPEETLAKVLAVYPDHSLADEALDYLIESSGGKVQELLNETKALLNERYGRQVRAGRNIAEEARAFSKEGLGSPTALRDMYRDVTGNQREPLVLFEELSQKFPYQKLQTVIRFLLHSLGSDLKAKGPSIPRAELARLIEETRSLQGILGIYRFFQSRAKLITSLFSKRGLSIPKVLTLETLSRIFVRILAEKYINMEKILSTAAFMEIADEIEAQIIIYAQMYDALRQIAPRYFRHKKHKQELYKAFIDTLEKLEKDKEEEEKEDD